VTKESSSRLGLDSVWLVSGYAYEFILNTVHST